MKEFNEEMLNKELEDLLESMPEQEQLEKKIERKIKRKIRKTVVHTMAVVTGIVIVLLLVINPIMNAIFLNPVRLNKEPEQKMLDILRTYFETTGPYIEPIDLQAEKKGFSRYKLRMYYMDHSEYMNYHLADIKMDVALGKYTNFEKSSDTSLGFVIPFDLKRSDSERYLDELKELPESSVIYLCIEEKTPRKLEELQNENINLQWVEVYQPNVEFQGGLSLERYAALTETDQRENMTAEELKEVYISNLKKLKESPQLWDIEELGLYDSHSWYEDREARLEETYEDAKKIKTIESKCYSVSGKKEEILEYLQKIDFELFQVEKVKLSEFPE